MNFSQKEQIMKIPNFYENVVPLLPPRIFRRYFRMYQDTMDQLTHYLREQIETNEILSRIPINKKVAMTCCFLGSTYTIIQ